jgi:hypothetical protein
MTAQQTRVERRTYGWISKYAGYVEVTIIQLRNSKGMRPYVEQIA